jgi:hypothetical protein
VEKPVESSQIHEGAVVGQVLDAAAEHPAFLEKLQRLLLARLLLDLDDRLAGENDVAALLVDGDDLEVEIFSAQDFEVLDRA